MLEGQLLESTDRARASETANSELMRMKIRLEEELSETERALKEGAEMHSEVLIILSLL